MPASVSLNKSLQAVDCMGAVLFLAGLVLLDPTGKKG